MNSLFNPVRNISLDFCQKAICSSRRTNKFHCNLTFTNFTRCKNDTNTTRSHHRHECDGIGTNVTFPIGLSNFARLWGRRLGAGTLPGPGGRPGPGSVTSPRPMSITTIEREIRANSSRL
jgi:hypothetical protein